uniref:LAGLIDADG homing endonuclease n=1 Tax=Romanomermis culicivorax TaxID=13658 RepID=A0A915KL77_ROMCU
MVGSITKPNLRFSSLSIENNVCGVNHFDLEGNFRHNSYSLQKRWLGNVDKIFLYNGTRKALYRAKILDSSKKVKPCNKNLSVVLPDFSLARQVIFQDWFDLIS